MAPYDRSNLVSSPSLIIAIIGLIGTICSLVIVALFCGCCQSGKKKEEAAAEGVNGDQEAQGKQASTSAPTVLSDKGKSSSGLSPPPEGLYDDTGCYAPSTSSALLRVSEAPSLKLSSQIWDCTRSLCFKSPPKSIDSGLAVSPSLCLMSSTLIPEPIDDSNSSGSGKAQIDHPVEVRVGAGKKKKRK